MRGVGGGTEKNNEPVGAGGTAALVSFLQKVVAERALA